jgi:outer membrane protein OmpA-like peptidoglycan-associated protein
MLVRNDEGNVGKISIFAVGVLLWIGMLIYCIPHEGHHIQQDLTNRSAIVLSNQNISSRGFAIDGRDVTLTGYVGTPEVSDKAVKLVQALWGVRSVRTNILDQAGKPAPIVTKQQAEAAATSITNILKLGNVEFFSGTERLTPGGQATLNQVVTVLAKYPGMRVEIAGHTDSVGIPEANLDLSRKRAATVKVYLVSKGIAAANLTDVGYGQTRPIASNDTAIGRQANRRVEFHTKENN